MCSLVFQHVQHILVYWNSLFVYFCRSILWPQLSHVLALTLNALHNLKFVLQSAPSSRQHCDKSNLEIILRTVFAEMQENVILEFLSDVSHVLMLVQTVFCFCLWPSFIHLYFPCLRLGACEDSRRSRDQIHLLDMGNRPRQELPKVSQRFTE